MVIYTHTHIYLITPSGHSLGGGLAILFAHNTLRYNERIISKYNIQLDVITFGSPMVFAKIANSEIMNKLYNICHNFVHLNDPIPRLPGSKQWVNNIIPSTIQQIIDKKLGYFKKIGNYFVAGVDLNDIKATFDSYITTSKLMTQTLNEYFPFGKYYFIGLDDKVKIIKKMDILQQCLSTTYGDLNSMYAMNDKTIFEDHSIAEYISMLDKTSNDKVIQLRHIDEVGDDVSKIEVMDELQKNTNSILKEIIKQNEIQLKKYKLLLDENENKHETKYDDLSNKINDTLQKCDTMIHELKQSSASTCANITTDTKQNYENILDQIQKQNDLMQSKLNQNNSTTLQQMNAKSDEILNAIKQQKTWSRTFLNALYIINAVACFKFIIEKMG